MSQKGFAHLLIILLVVAIAGLLIIGLPYLQKFQNQATQKLGISRQFIKPASAVAYFSIVSVSPPDNSTGMVSDADIHMTFSEPVKPDSLRGFFSVSPMIPGNFSKGATDNEVVFKSKFPYGDGTAVKVILNKGLESVSGDKLTSDYTFNFSTRVPDKNVTFQYGDIFSRWVNLPVGQKLTFNLLVGTDVSSDGTITLYKGTEDGLLSALTYKNQTHTDSNYITQTFNDRGVNSSKMEQISKTQGLTNGATYDFNQGAGLYYIEAKSSGEVVGATWVNVTDEGLIVKQDDKQVVVATQNIKTGDYNSSIKVKLFNLKDSATLLASQDITNNGEIAVAANKVVDLVVGETDSGLVLVPLAIPQSQADIREPSNIVDMDKIYLTTDKPTYKSGEIVHFSGIVRMDNDAKYNLPDSGSKVRVWVADPTDATKKIVDQTISVGDGGIISGQFSLPAGLIPQNQGDTTSSTLYAKLMSDSATYLNSRSYVTFDSVASEKKEVLKVKFDKTNYLKNEAVVAHVTGLDASGGPLANVQVNYNIYSKNYFENDPSSAANFGTDLGTPSESDGGQVTLNPNGQVDIKIPNDGSSISQEKTIQVSADTPDGTIYGAKTVLVSQGKLYLTFGPSRGQYHSGDTTVTRVYVKDLSGNPAQNLGLTYRFFQSQYQTNTNSYEETTLRQGYVKSDGNGLAIIKEPFSLSPGAVTISVTVQDSDGTNIEAERTINFYDPNTYNPSLYYHNLTLSNLDVSTDKLTYNAGDNANLTINSPFDQNVLLTFESGRIYHDEWVHLNKGDNSYGFNVSTDLAPSFSVVFSYFNNGNLNIEGFPILVSDYNKKLTVSVTADKNAFSANDSAQLTISTKDASGQGTPAKISVDILRDDIFNLRDNMPSGDVSWYFYAPRIVTTNSSASSLGIGTGGGCGGGSGIDIKYVPNRVGQSILFQQTLTDQNGQAQITVPLKNASGLERILVTGSTDSTAVGAALSNILVQ